MTSLIDLTNAIRAAAHDLIRTADPAGLVELEHLLSHTETASPAPGRKPTHVDAVAKYLPGMLANEIPAPWAPVATTLADTWDQLAWVYHYAERDDVPGLGARVAFAELAGPGAPMAAESVRVGFTFIAPGVLYPMHDHPAVELYVVLSGRALWTRGTEAAWQDPGAIIVHASMEPHAMETAEEPMLALYSWRGDIDSPARYTTPPLHESPLHHSKPHDSPSDDHNLTDG